MKKNDLVLREYVSKLSDENIDFLQTRFEQNRAGDLSDCLDFMSRNQDMDRLLCSASSVDEFYVVIDHIVESVRKEITKREKDKKLISQ